MKQLTAAEVLVFLLEGKRPKLSADDALVWDRLWEKVDVRSEVKCWRWRRGTSQRDGYSLGVFQDIIDGARTVGTPQRAVFRLTRGRIPVATRTSCGDSLCCNPDHVIETRKGKPSSLTPAQVAEIKTRKGDLKTIAREFRCSARHIRFIRSEARCVVPEGKKK